MHPYWTYNGLIELYSYRHWVHMIQLLLAQLLNKIYETNVTLSVAVQGAIAILLHFQNIFFIFNEMNLTHDFELIEGTESSECIVEIAVHSILGYDT